MCLLPPYLVERVLEPSSALLGISDRFGTLMLATIRNVIGQAFEALAAGCAPDVPYAYRATKAAIRLTARNTTFPKGGRLNAFILLAPIASKSLLCRSALGDLMRAS